MILKREISSDLQFSRQINGNGHDGNVNLPTYEKFGENSNITEVCPTPLFTSRVHNSRKNNGTLPGQAEYSSVYIGLGITVEFSTCMKHIKLYINSGGL